MKALLLSLVLAPAAAAQVPAVVDLNAAMESARALAAATRSAYAPKKLEPTPMPLPAGSPLAEAQAFRVLPGLYHLHFPTQHLLTSTFLRFQEYYESPEFKGKTFTLEEYMDWYAKAQGKKGHFSYFSDWTGFNLPWHVLDTFRTGAFDPLTAKEKAMLELFKDDKGPFTIIGTYGKMPDPGVLHHEICHALYLTEPLYRVRADAILKTVDVSKILPRLREKGYHEDVLMDEVQAYLSENPGDHVILGPEWKSYEDARRRLRALYRLYVVEEPTK